MKLLLVGRSAHADVVIPDASVSAFHVEAVITADGRCHITDRVSAQGTYHRPSDADAWTSVRQVFVDMSDQIRLGDYVSTVADLLGGALDEGLQDELAGTDGGSGANSAAAADTVARPRGAVERDPVTGEIVKRRL